MALSYTVPVAGTDLNSIADPEISTALTLIKTWANGEIEGTDISPSAGILGSQLSATAGITNAQLASGGVYTGATYTQGLLAARPTPAAGVGTFYEATDVNGGTLYASNGTTWLVLNFPTAWTALSLPTGFVNSGGGFRLPSYRMLGDVVQLDGYCQSNSSWTAFPAFTGLPAAGKNWSAPMVGGFSSVMSAGGTTLTVGTFTGSGQGLWLSNLSYPTT